MDSKSFATTSATLIHSIKKQLQTGANSWFAKPAGTYHYKEFGVPTTGDNTYLAASRNSGANQQCQIATP